MSKLPPDTKLEHENYRAQVPAEKIEELRKLAIKKKTKKVCQSNEPTPVPLLYNKEEEEALDEAMAELEILELD